MFTEIQISAAFEVMDLLVLRQILRCLSSGVAYDHLQSLSNLVNEVWNHPAAST